MLKTNLSSLTNFFVSETHESLAALDELAPAYRAVMVSDGTLTTMLSALHLETINTTCLESATVPAGPEQQRWLEIPSEPCLRRSVELTGASSAQIYVRACSYLYEPRLPPAFLRDLSRAGASLGTQLLQSRISTRRELIWVRASEALAFSRLYRILLHDRPAILVQEDFLRPT
jgi:chorismate-pyruvate lyase